MTQIEHSTNLGEHIFNAPGITYFRAWTYSILGGILATPSEKSEQRLADTSLPSVFVLAI
jgi:hypothetical protein